ncbi:MAG TPA: response regulator [Myxococcota bacterium]|nr:response regulator [Myxococcota bacterium]HQK51927.1 response regulator [Myxococcota bacterium]
MSAAEARGARGTALVIEDQSGDLAALREVLQQLGYDPVALEEPARSALDAWDHRARLVVLCADVRNGFNLCLKLKKHPVWKRTPLILTTGKASPEVIRKHRLLPTRADAYLFKPLKVEELIQAIREVLPEDFEPAPSDHEAELPVGAVAERTLVSPGQLENAVVNYVEDEVRTIRSTLERLISEKPPTGPVPVQGIDPVEFQTRLEEVRALARQQAEAAFAVERERLRTELLQQQALVIEAQGQAEEVRRDLADARRRQAEAEARAEEARRETAEVRGHLAEALARQEELRAELDQTTLLFERLEAGYKDAQRKIEAERDAALEEAARLEAELAAAREEVEAQWRTALEEARGAEAASRQEVERVNKELQGMKRRLEAATAAGARVAELEGEVDVLTQQLETARQALLETESIRQAEADARREIEALRARIDQARKVLEEDA